MEDWLKSMPVMMSSLMDAFWGTKDARGQALQRQTLYRKAYLELLDLWNVLMTQAAGERGESIALGDGSDVQQALETFRVKMAAIFEEFEIGANYSRVGLLEKLSHYFSKQIHRSVASNESLVKELQHELERFWNGFFALVRKAEAQQDPKAEWEKTRAWLVDKEMTEVPDAYMPNFTAASLLITDLTADGMRKGMESHFQEGGLHEAMGPETYSDMLAAYGGLLHRKIGNHLTETEQLRVATTVMTRITPQIMDCLVSKMEELCDGDEIWKMSQGFALVVGAHLLFEWLWAIETMVSLDDSYRSLMQLKPVAEYNTEADFVILEAFGPNGNIAQMPQKIAEALTPKIADPAATTREESERISLLMRLATVMGGIPPQSIFDPELRMRAGEVFTQRACSIVAVYLTLKRGLNGKDREGQYLVAPLDKLKQILHRKEVLLLQNEIHGLGVKHLVSNIEVQLPDRLHDLAEYTARYLANDIRHELEYHYSKALSAEVAISVRYFADYVYNIMDKPQLKMLITKMDAAVNDWWPLGKMEDGKAIPVELLKDYAIWIGSRDFSGPLDEFMGSLNDFHESLKQSLKPSELDTVAVSQQPERRVDMGQITGFNEQQLFVALADLAFGSYVVDLANQWASLYFEKAIEAIVEMQALDKVATAADKREYAKSKIQYLGQQIREVCQGGIPRNLELADFQGGGSGRLNFSAGIPDDLKLFIFYKNVALNLEKKFHHDERNLQLYDPLEASLRDLVSKSLETELSNVLKRSVPDLKLTEEFNPLLDYDASTFNGVVARLMRNVTAAFNRNQQRHD